MVFLGSHHRFSSNEYSKFWTNSFEIKSEQFLAFLERSFQKIERKVFCIYFDNLPDNIKAETNNTINQSHSVIALEKNHGDLEWRLRIEDLELEILDLDRNISVFQITQKD